MKKNNKQNLLLFFYLLLLMFPNIVFVLVGQDSAVASLLKKIVFLLLSFAVIIFPLVFIKPKIYTLFILLLIPFILFESSIINHYKTSSSEETVASIFLTNYYEVTELLKGNFKNIIFSAALFLTAFILYFFINSKHRFPKKIKRGVFISVILIFSTLYFRNMYAGSKLKKTYTEIIGVANYSLNVQMKKIFPLSIFSKLYDARNGIEKKKNYKKTIKNFKFKAYKNDTINSPEIYVLVIGETARKHNLSAYGYLRNTTPYLDTISNITALRNVRSAANLTSLSIPFILTRATPLNPSIKFTEPAVINAFKEAGFKTYWLSNQSIGIGSVFGFYSSLADVYQNTSISIDVAHYDQVLFPVLKEVLNDPYPKKFIVIHILGSHFRYNYRYPNYFKKFTPTSGRKLSLENSLDISKKQELINGYDNSILYTDFVLNNFIQQLKNKKASSFLYYISDHGENIFDTEENKILHAYLEPSKYEIEIPLLIWKSKKYISNYLTKTKVLEQNIDKDIVSNYTFHTLLDMANISYPTEDLTKSFVNIKFDTLQPQYFYKTDKTILQLK